MVTHKILLFLLVACVSLVFWNCVDVPSEGQVPPDYYSLMRVVNVATDAPLASGNFSVDGSVAGNLSLGTFSSYLTVKSGGRVLAFEGDTITQKVVLGSNRQYTVLIVPINGTNRFLSLDEGYTFNNNGSADVAQIRFINASTGSSGGVSFRDTTESGPDLSADVAYLVANGYTDVTPGTHTIVAVSSADTVALPASSFEAGHKYVVVASGAGSTLTLLQISERQPGVTKFGTER